MIETLLNISRMQRRKGTVLRTLLRSKYHNRNPSAIGKAVALISAQYTVLLRLIALMGEE
jgi:hypothetical protein